MPFRTGIGKELTRSTICGPRSRGSVTLMCSDRIPAGSASELFVGVDWSNFDGDVTLTFRKVTAAGGGEIRFGDAAGPASRTFSGKTRQLVPIFGLTPTAGADPDVLLDVIIDGETIDSLRLSVGPVATTVAIMAADGVSQAPDLLLPEVGVTLKAVPSPAGIAEYSWLTTQPAALAISGPASHETVDLLPAASPAPALLAPDGSLAVCVLFTPVSGPAVMAVQRTWTLSAPERPGPFPVGRTTYTDADFPIGAGLEGLGAINVSVEALVRYPAEVAGDGTPFSPRRATYPLVILAHGRHGASEFERNPDGSLKFTGGCGVTPILDGAGLRPEFKNYEGLEYLASHLASYGFIAVSVNLNGKYDPVTGDGELVPPQGVGLTCHTADEVAITHRAATVLRHALVMKGKHGADPLFGGKVDLDNVGLIGHSRGGEAVAAAQVLNRGLPPADQAGIKAVVSIAPTDFRGHSVNSPFLAIVGSDDGDVSEAQGLRLYDRAVPPKQLVWVTGGIHNFFSSNWQWQDEVPTAPVVSRPQHEAIAKGYCNLFLQANLRGVAGTTPYFSGQRRLASLTGVDLHHSLRVPGGTVVDDFEPPLDKAKNLLSQAVVDTDLDSFKEEALNRFTPACGAGRPGWFQDTTGLLVEWSAATASYKSELGSLDASAPGTVLSFRVGQDQVGNPGGPQNCKVTLADGAGQTATLRVGDFTVIPPPRDKSVINGFTPLCTPIGLLVSLSFLKTARLPMARFKAANAALDLANLASVTFEFSVTPSGLLGIDDLEFSL